MALPKSRTADSKVTQLDAVRKQRPTKRSAKKQPGSDSASSASPEVVTKTTGRTASKVSPASTPAKRSASRTADTQDKPDADALPAETMDATDTAPKAAKKATATRVSNRRFDTEKVERLKAAIASGQYEINYLRVADKFIEHERYA